LFELAELYVCDFGDYFGEKLEELLTYSSDQFLSERLGGEDFRLLWLLFLAVYTYVMSLANLIRILLDQMNN